MFISLKKLLRKKKKKEVHKAQPETPKVIRTDPAQANSQPAQTEDFVEVHQLIWPFNLPPENRNVPTVTVSRKDLRNPCAIFLGCSGAGKTIFAMSEIYNALIEDPDCQVIIIDNYASVDKLKRWRSNYDALASYAGGTFISTAPDSDDRIDPFPEISEGYTVEMVETLVCGWYESAIGGKRRITTKEKAVIYRCLMDLYSTHSRFTAKDFFSSLGNRSETEAKSIAAVLSDVFNTSLPVFAGPGKTQDISGRVLIYGVKNDYLNEYKNNKDGNGALAMLCCISDAWSRVVANSRKGIRTWLYLDDVEFLAALPSATEYIDMLFRKAADHNCVPTMILHGVDNRCLSDDMLYRYGTSGLMLIMNSTPMSIHRLNEILPLTPAYKSFLWCYRNFGCGEGVVIIGGKPYCFQYYWRNVPFRRNPEDKYEVISPDR